MHRTHQLLAAKNADRERSQAVAQARIARRAAALEAAVIAAGIAASKTDQALQDLIDEFADVPALVVADAADPDPDFEAEAEADAAWMDKHARVAIWQGVMRRTTAAIEAVLVTSILRAVVIAELHAQSHRHAVRIRNILSRLARDTLSALLHARLRVVHICTIARIARAGRAASAASAAPARC